MNCLRPKRDVIMKLLKTRKYIVNIMNERIKMKMLPLIMMV